MSALIGLHVEHAKRTYRRRSGEPTRQHKNISSALKRWTVYAGEASDLARLNRHQVRAWLDQLAAERDEKKQPALSRTYINACLKTLRAFVRWCADLDYIPLAVVTEISLVKPLRPLRCGARETVARVPATLSQIEAVAAFLPPLPRDVLHLSRLTGARPSELLEITNAEIHLDDCPRLTPLQHKTAHHGKSRVIPLCTAAVAIVERRWRPLCPADHVFPSPRGGHYTLSGYTGALKRAAKKAGVKDLQPYDVRRRAGREVRKHAGLDAAQALLGHAHASTTEIYAPVDASDSDAFTLAKKAAQEVLQ